MWTYHQSSGKMLSPDGNLLAIGYAGAGAGRNNPASQNIPNVGPLPRGKYTIAKAQDHPHFGPVMMRLNPFLETEMFGRDGMLIHAENRQHMGSSSHGCIVLPRFAREAIAASEDRVLLVVG